MIMRNDLFFLVFSTIEPTEAHIKFLIKHTLPPAGPTKGYGLNGEYFHKV